MGTKCFITLTFIFFSLSLHGQKEGLASINIDALKGYMTFLASDEMKGRETGTTENNIAALYIRSNLMRLGLKPLPETGDYLQKVPIISSEIKGNDTHIRASSSNGEEIFSTDSILYLMAPFSTLETSSRLVFAGYGFTDSTSGYDDYKDIDVKDKVVMIMTGSPQVSDPEVVNSVFNIDLERKKIMAAFGKQAKAVIYVYDPRSKYTDAYASGLADMGIARVGSKFMTLKIPENSSVAQIGFITGYAADQILKKSGSTLKALQEKIIREKKACSFESSEVEVSFKTFVEQNEIRVSNVIGMIEGSDPAKKNECIIYTAHFDHIGVNKKGEAFNGADDNASGSSALLVVAQAYMNLKKKPPRTVIFAWVNGEEKGLLGSQYYAENPVISLDNTLMDINLDMVGRSKMPSDTGKFMGFDVDISGKDEIFMYTDQKGGDIMNIVKSSSGSAGIKVTNKGKDPLIGSSDYANFMGKGVPVIFLNSGDYPDLHSIMDDVEKIDFDKMQRVSEMVFLMGFKIANLKNRFIPNTIN
jgi:hypothetical protein